MSDPAAGRPTPRCPYRDEDAVYLLGALDPSEQQAFRAHLTDCASCRAAVSELSVMPGLLARLLPTTEGPPEPVPGLLPELAERVRAERRSSRWRFGLAGFLAAALLGVGGAFVLLPTPGDDPDRVLTMAAASGVPVEATLLVTGRGWGTSIDTTCRYDAEDGNAHSAPTYELWAIDADGHDILVSSWRQIADKEITVPGSVGLGLADIRRLEVRTTDGTTILSTEP